MERRVRWGILGYAGIARKHVLPAMVKAGNVRLTAIASRSQEKLMEAVSAYGFPKVYGSYEQLLADPEIDAVYIPLPNALHKEWAIRAAEQGKHVLCEKPLALTEADCREMAAAFQKNRVYLMEAFMYRFLPGMKTLKTLLDQGEIGEVRHIYSTHRFYLGDNQNVRVNAALGGGSLRDVGCYPVNLLGWILEDYPVAISAKKNVFQGVDHALAVNLKYPNGVTANISCGFDGHSMKLTEINGTKGGILVRSSFIDSSLPIEVFYGDGRICQIPVEESDCYQLEVEEFSDAVLQGRRPALGLEETIRNCRLIEAILEAARE